MIGALHKPIGTTSGFPTGTKFWWSEDYSSTAKPDDVTWRQDSVKACRTNHLGRYVVISVKASCAGYKDLIQTNFYSTAGYPGYVLICENTNSNAHKIVVSYSADYFGCTSFGVTSPNGYSASFSTTVEKGKAVFKEATSIPASELNASGDWKAWVVFSDRNAYDGFAWYTWAESKLR